MRKFTAIFLALAIVCSLFGCAQGSQEQDSKPQYSITDLMVNMAVEITRQMGMQAEEGFMSAMNFPAEVVSKASIFQEAVDAKNITAKVATGVLKTLPTDITTLCGQRCGISEVACCGALAETIQIYTARKLETPTAVYLRYSESCHFIVVFTPLGDNLASVWAYPLFANVAEKVLELYFSEAEELDAGQVKDACKVAANALYKAQCTDQEVNADHYIQMATNAIQSAKPLGEKEIIEYTSEQKILANVMNMSRLMYCGVQFTHVYRYPDRLQSQVDTMLSDAKYGQQLQAYVQQQFYLTYPNQICNRYGAEWSMVNAILNAELKTGNMGAVAREDEEPVLVLMDLKGSASLLMSIYPSEHNIYLYSYAVLPVSYKDVQAILIQLGASRMK